MSIIKCKGCGSITNTVTSHTKDDKGICFVKWVNLSPQKGCGYDKITSKDFRDYMDDIIKKG